MSTTADPTSTGAEDVAWDLSDIYAGPGDPALEADLGDARTATAAFRERYAGKVAELDAEGLLEATTEIERIDGIVVRARAYAYLHFSTNTADPARGALLQRIQEQEAALETELLFFRLEWTELDDERAEALLADAALEEYRHFLHALRRYRPYLLSEPEERILTEKSVSGSSAWARLYNELLTAIRVRLDGEEAALEQGLSRLYAGDREVRRAAAEAIREGLADGMRTRAFVFNTLLVDKTTDDRLRGYEHWLQARNLSNETPDETVTALVDAVVSRYDIPQRYYTLKARLLGIDKLAHYDRMAPVSQTPVTMTWEEATRLVAEAYASFSTEAGRIVSDFFDRRWVDAPVRPDKHIGAYCMTRVPGVHPYVLMNFTGDRRSVLTLAHELGHGLHGVLAQDRGVFNSETPLTLAETASVFGEALTFRSLMAGEEDPKRRLDMLIGRIDDAVATVFRQIALNRFEDAVHGARRGEGELAPDRFSELWEQTQRAMLGDSVDLDGYETWWSYVPHFVVSPGYVYAYSYGYLFSLAIFRAWEREGDELVEPYLDLLRAGGSKPPEELAAIVGLDLSDRGLWEDGLEAIDELLAEAEDSLERRKIVALGGSSEPAGPLVRFLLSLTGKERPRVCFLPTAVGDDPSTIVVFYERFPASLCEPSHLELFGVPRAGIREHLLAQDVVYVSGGNSANMLAVWRVHGVDAVMREAWDAGIVLCGPSAGGLCWFEGAVTDSFGPELALLDDGLGFLQGSFCPHYDGEPERRPTYERLIREGLVPGYAADDAVGVHFRGTELAEVVTEREGATAYRVELVDADVRETPLQARLLT